MDTSLSRGKIYEFGVFRLDPAVPLLLRGGELVPLAPKTLDLLVALLEKGGALVSKEELVNAVWPDTFVEESNLTHHISILRKTLGNAENGQAYIETISKRGYRFAGTVQKVAGNGHAAGNVTADSLNHAETPEPVTRNLPTVRPVRSTWFFIATLLVLGASVLALILFRGAPVDLRPVRFAIAAPEGAAFGPSPPAISPDGTRLAFVATLQGRSLLWVRPLDALVARSLPGTEGASHPFWSPDGHFIGFFAEDRKLKKIDIAGGTVETLCATAGFPFGGTWNRDNVIIFGSTSSPLYRVSAAGGTPTPVITVGATGQIPAQFWPHFLPDGRHFFYFSRSEEPGESGIYVTDLTSSPGSVQKSDRLVTSNAGAVYVPPTNGREGYLLFLREGTLIAQLFDAGALKMKGEAFPVVEQLGGSDTSGLPRFAVSQTGVLVYRPGGTGLHTRLAWFDRNGHDLGTIVSVDEFSHPTLSPDGKAVAFELPDLKSAIPAIWMLDLARGAASRVTHDSARHKAPVWSADGSRIIFGSDSGHTFQIAQAPAAGGEKEQVLLESPNWIMPTGVFGNKFLVYEELIPKTKWDVRLLPLTGDRKPVPFLQDPFGESHGQISADGRWMAYESNETGRWEIYARSFPDPKTKVMISTGGGVQPRWRRDGKEVFYFDLDRKLMAADVKAGSTLEAGPPKTLFQVRGLGSVSVVGRAFEYDVSADGQRFLINTPADESNTSPITVVLNWHPK